MEKCFLIYKITNQINQKFYIGKHETFNMDDGYMGSGLAIKSAIKKYGPDNFKKEILYIFDSRKQMEDKERELLTEDALSNPLCYNIALGGQGGNLGSVVNKKISESTSRAMKGVSKTEEHKKAIQKAKKLYKPTKDTITKIKKTAVLNYQNMSKEEKNRKYGHSGSSNGSAKSVTLNGVSYSTRKECCQMLNISKSKLYRLLGEK
jgi:group I intron endonuclease